MTKAKAAKPLTADQLAAQAPFADGPPPSLGGAWVRNADGTLTRDGDHEQHIPEDEDRALDPAPAFVPPPPATEAGDSTKSQEG